MKLSAYHPFRPAQAWAAYLALYDRQAEQWSIASETQMVNTSYDQTLKSAIELTEYAVLYGKAYIVAGGAAELLQKLTEVYIRPGVKFPPMDNPPPSYVVHIRVDRIAGVGPWTGRAV